VALQVALLAEANAATLARVGLLVGVDAPVSGEVVLHAEALAADVARMILLARVHGQVAQHLLPPAESLRAVRALVRELVRVSPAVDVERCLRLEGFAARVADVRPFASVDTPVILHGGLHREAAPADIARMILHAVVHVLQVIVQAATLTELLAAHVARVRLLARVRARVRPLAFPRAEFLVAKAAAHRRSSRGDVVLRSGPLVDLGRIAPSSLGWHFLLRVPRLALHRGARAYFRSGIGIHARLGSFRSRFRFAVLRSKWTSLGRCFVFAS